MGFHNQIRRSWLASESMFCVGLDPDPARFPRSLGSGPDSILTFCKEIVDATADLVCAFKPQIAHFASQRAEPQLEELCTYIREAYPDVTLVLDAKRGDIGPTAAHYAHEAFVRYHAHVVTVNPYLGTDSVAPYFEHDAGVLAVCRTSNPGGGDVQGINCDGSPLYLRVAEMVRDQWSRYGDCGLVVGATYPSELRAVREVVADLPVLVPGVGAQGGNYATVIDAGRDSKGWGVIASSSRAILYASTSDDFPTAARAAAIQQRDISRVSNLADSGSSQ